MLASKSLHVYIAGRIQIKIAIHSASHFVILLLQDENIFCAANKSMGCIYYKGRTHYRY
jgi:hypothetical protein